MGIITPLSGSISFPLNDPIRALLDEKPRMVGRAQLTDGVYLEGEIVEVDEHVSFESHQVNLGWKHLRMVVPFDRIPNTVDIEIFRVELEKLGVHLEVTP